MRGQRRALIIANDEYEQEGLQNLLAPAADAEALGRVLSDPQIGDFAVQVVRNEPAHVIQGHIEEVFSESRPDDVLLLHFSGHGLKSESGELFFAACNTRPNRLGSTAVSADFVQRCMRDSRSRSIVLLLDCCYGGAFARGVKVRAAGDIDVLDSFPQGRSGGGRGRAVITASSAMEYAFEGDQLDDDQERRPSVFTTALVEGLTTGDADQDEDGWVSLNELYDYVFDKVSERNPHQTPSRRIEFEGELYLARSRRRRVRPVPIPPDLQAALADTNMFARLGAVTELQHRLVGNDLPIAVGAYEALTEVVRTATRYLADTAAEALSATAVTPAQTEVHFGRTEQGSAPPHQTVKLLGPPIARACVPRPSHDWIRVDQAGETLDVSIDTSGTGTLRGSVNLKGPTGEAVIALDIELVSPLTELPAHRGHERVVDPGTLVAAAKCEDDELTNTTEREVAKLRATADHEVAEKRAGAERDIAKLRTSTEREVAQLKATAKRERDEILTTSKRQADEMRSQAQRILEESEAQRAQAEAEFEIQLAARREEAERQEAERLSAAQSATQKLVSEAEQRASTAEQRAAKASAQTDQTRRDADSHARQLVSNAKKNADQIVSQAKTQADQLLAETKADAERRRAVAQREVDELTREKDSIATHLAQVRQLLGGQLPGGATPGTDKANQPTKKAHATTPPRSAANNELNDEDWWTE